MNTSARFGVRVLSSNQQSIVNPNILHCLPIQINPKPTRGSLESKIWISRKGSNLHFLNPESSLDGVKSHVKNRQSDVERAFSHSNVTLPPPLFRAFDGEDDDDDDDEEGDGDGDGDAWIDASRHRLTGAPKPRARTRAWKQRGARTWWNIFQDEGDSARRATGGR